MRSALLLTAAAMTFAACAATGTTDTASPNPIGAGVGVVADGCSLTPQVGSGVVVGNDHQVVTVAHTLRGATSIVVLDSAGREHAATVTSFDKNIDLAVLDVPTLDADPLVLGDVAIGPGRTLTWSRDDGVEVADVDVTKRLSITIEDIYTEGEYQRSGLEVAGDIAVGDSGGAVLDGNDAVIGVIYARSRARGGVGFATDASEIAAVVAARSDEPVDNGRC